MALEAVHTGRHVCRMALHALSDFRKQSGRKLEDLAAETGISVSQLSRYETGKRDPKLNDLERLAKAFNTSISAILGEPSPVTIPIISWVSAGRMWAQEPVRDGQVLRHIKVNDLPKGDWIALEVDGGSMDRIAPEGSVICVNREDQRLIAGKYYVFSYDSGETTFKQYRSSPDRLQPFSTNPDYETIYPDGELRVVGRVWRVINDLT